MKARLVLEDGSCWEGVALGAQGRVFGEVVFNTSMTGYQEILTDPSYRGEIVVMTYPLIGNYGINEEDFESARPQVQGFVVREACAEPSNWRARESLDRFLARHGVVGIAGVDTRALTRRLREQGTMKGVISTDDAPVAELVEAARQAPSLSDQDLVQQVCTPYPYLFADGHGPHVVVVDYGAKANIPRELALRGCRVTVAPGTFTAAELLRLGPDGVVLSNGPGDPERITFAHEAVRGLVGRVPLFGICLGHQIIGLALGGQRFRLKYGHRGANHPVKDLETGRAYITSQNHGFAIADGSWSDPDLLVSHRSLNDGTIEGFRHRSLPIFSVQYHPEASPGPRDSRHLFDRFLEAMALVAGQRSA